MSDHSGTGLPASIEAAWGVRDRPHKGPKPGLSLERIVDAAVAVAQSEGLAAVSMSRVAAELGAATMSLYRYVAAKDELIDLMVDAALGPPTGDPPAGGWRAGLSAWAWSYMELLRRCPWVTRVRISAPPITPNNIAWFERGLSAMRNTGLGGGEKVGVILLISAYVRSVATLEADITEAMAASGTSEPVWTAYGRLLTKLTDAEHFPALHEVIASGALDEEPGEQDPDVDFTFGLERVLDGIEVLVRRRARSAP